MELYDVNSKVEEILVRRADAMCSPYGGTIELLPLCNLDCKMCYVHLSKSQMNQRGRMLTCDQWLKIAEEAKQAGVLNLLLTGGEPLLFPEFKRLFRTLQSMGFVLTVNTNGTLIDQEWADFFAETPCRRLNITLYGPDAETYQNLCGNGEAFNRVMEAASLLKERNVPFRFNFSITNENKNRMEDNFSLADSLNVPIFPCTYMFPAVRRGSALGEQNRMTPQEAAMASVRCFVLKNPGMDPKVLAWSEMGKMVRENQIPYKDIKGLICPAGRSGFWLDWRGSMHPCGFMEEISSSLLEHSFQESWDYILEETQKLHRCEECDTCEVRGICRRCAAASLTEAGSIDGKPEYLCEMTKEYYRLLQEILKGDTDRIF